MAKGEVGEVEEEDGEPMGVDGEEREYVIEKERVRVREETMQRDYPLCRRPFTA